MAAEISEEERSYTSRFYGWIFRKFIRVVFVSRGFARFNRHSLAHLLA